MKITAPSALFTPFLVGGSGRNNGGLGIVRAFSSSYSSSAAAAAAGGIRAGLQTTKGTTTTTTTTTNYYSTTLALRGSASAAASPGGQRKVTTTTAHARPTKLTTSTTRMEEMINKTDVFIFDCDGVIWRVRGEIQFLCIIIILSGPVFYVYNFQIFKSVCLRKRTFFPRAI